MFRLAAAAYLKPPSHSTVVPASVAGLRSPGGYPSSTVVIAGSHPDSDPGLQTMDGGTPVQPGLRVVSSSGSLEVLAGICFSYFHALFVWSISVIFYLILVFTNLESLFSAWNCCLIRHLSLGPAGTSPLSGIHILGESAGGITNVGSRSWKRSDDGNVYVQCVTAVYTLARDPFPRVACLGRQVLRIMGVESAQILTPVRNKAGSHQRNSSVPALPPSPSIAGVLHRSTSWVASTSGLYIINVLTLLE